MTSDLEMERAYSGFGTPQICHLLTYLDTYPLNLQARTTHGATKLVTTWTMSEI